MAARPRIVLAHGRAAQFDIPDSTSRLWADALRLSLLRVGSKYADQVDVDYAYFGGFWRTDTKHASPRFRDPMSAMFPSTPPGRTIQHGQNWGRTAEATNPFVAHDPLDYLSSLAMGVALHAALEETH